MTTEQNPLVNLPVVEDWRGKIKELRKCLDATTRAVSRLKIAGGAPPFDPETARLLEDIDKACGETRNSVRGRWLDQCLEYIHWPHADQWITELRDNLETYRRYVRNEEAQRDFNNWLAKTDHDLYLMDEDLPVLEDSQTTKCDDSDLRSGAVAHSPKKSSEPEPGLKKLLHLYTDGVSDEKMKQAALVLDNRNLTVNEKLYKLDALIPIPANTSARGLGQLFGVSGQAIMDTDWWKEKRKGKKDEEISRRERKMIEKGQKLERREIYDPDDE
jgi:hypothetical protein